MEDAWVKQWAQERSQAQPEDFSRWETAGIRLLQTGLSLPKARGVMLTLQDSAAIDCLTRWLEDAAGLPEGADQAYENLLLAVENSDFDLRQWIRALAVFYSWADAASRTCRWSQSLGYLECCAAAVHARPVVSFHVAVREFLSEHGFTGE